MMQQATVVFCVFPPAHRSSGMSLPVQQSLRLISCAMWMSKIKCRFKLRTYASSCRIELHGKNSPEHIGCPTVLQLNCCKSTFATPGATLLTTVKRSKLTLRICWKLLCLKGSDHKGRDIGALTRRSDMGVLSLAGRCCSRARTMQLAIIVARIMYSNRVWGLRNIWKMKLHSFHFTACVYFPMERLKTYF